MKRSPLPLCLAILAGVIALCFLSGPPVEKADPVAGHTRPLRPAAGEGHFRPGPMAPPDRSPVAPAALPEPPGSAASAGVSFFRRLEKKPLEEIDQSDERVNQSVLSRMVVDVDWGVLSDIRKNGRGQLAINTGAQGILTADIDKAIGNWGGGYSLSGGIRGFPLGTFIATVHEDALVASIRTGMEDPGHFMILKNPKGIHELRHLDTSGMPSCDDAVTPAPSQKATHGDASGLPLPEGRPRVENDIPPVAADDGSVIDLMVVYTALARADRGGTNGMIASINQTITESNQAFGGSGISTTLRLAHSAEISYAETSNSSTDLDRLAGKSDGSMDTVHALRNTYAADIVSLWTQSSYSGVGYLMRTLSDTFESNAFNVCDVDYAVSNYTLTHECGHNMGCAHDAANATVPGLYPYSYGWRWNGSNGTQYRSVMAYSPGTRVLRFSNPSVSYSGGATGTASANNALTINNARITVSSWRAASGTPAFSINPTSQNAPPEPGSYNFIVTAAGTWSWTSTGGTGWVSTTEPATQNGTQTFSYSLAENTLSTSRSATIILTSGSLTQVHAITQAGSTVDDHGNTAATATPVSQSSTTSGNIGIAGDLDYFRINVTGAGTLVVSTAGTTDTYGTLLNSSGTILATNDDDETVNFRISQAVTAGTYYVQVKHFTGIDTGNYQLVCALTAAGASSLDPATLSAPAAPGSYSFEVTSDTSWTWSDDAPWLTSSEAVTQTGNQLFIYTLAQNTSAASRIAVVTLVMGSVTWTHTVTQAAATTDDHGNTTATARLISQNSTTSGKFEIPGDEDFFRIEIASPGNLVVRTTGTTDTYGYLLSATGNVMAFNDDENAASVNFQVSYAVQAGTFYVRARHFSGTGTGAYQLISSYVSTAIPEISVEYPTGFPLTDGNAGVPFSTVTLGSSVTRTLTLRNLGPAPLTGNTATFTGGDAADFSVITAAAPAIGASGASNLIIRFLPTAAGPRTTTLQIASNDGDENPFDITLTGSGIPVPAPEITVQSPEGMPLTDAASTVAFGAMPAGYNSTRSFLVRNEGTLSLTGVAVSFSGGNFADYAVTEAPAATVTAGTFTTFTIRLTPSGAGARNTTMRIASNDADENPFDVALSGALMTPRQIYDGTVTTAGLTGTAALPGSVPHGDGTANLLKYAFNLNLSGSDGLVLVPGTGTAGLPSVVLEGSGTLRTLKVEYLRRKNSGLTYLAKRSAGSLIPAPMTPMTGTPAVTLIDANWERVIIRDPLNLSTTPRNFAVVEVGLP